MDNAALAGQQPVGHGATATRLAVVLGGRRESPRACRVEAPDRVLRMWSVLSTANDELHQKTLPPGAAARLQQQLEAVTTELERSVSPALADELRRLIGQRGTVPPTPAQMRVEYASVTGWTGGLVIAMLGELDAARANHARLAGTASHPARNCHAKRPLVLRRRDVCPCRAAHGHGHDSR